jgi:hypothetical protein
VPLGSRQDTETRRRCFTTAKSRITFDYKAESLTQVLADLEKQTNEKFVIEPKGLHSGAIKAETAVTAEALISRTATPRRTYWPQSK